MGTLDDVTIAAFMSFVRDDLTQLIDPEEILSTDDFSKIEEKIEKISVDKEGNKRTDRISTICTRLFILIIKEGFQPSAKEQDNLISFIKSNKINKELRFNMAKDISNEASQEIKDAIYSDPQISKMLIDSMRMNKNIDDELSRWIVQLLIKEPFYAPLFRASHPHNFRGYYR